MEIKKVKIDKLNFAPYNPRVMSDEMYEKLKNSIKSFGYVEPIVVNKRTMNVVGGNQRLQALKDLGVDEVEAVCVDLDEEQEKALNIALNKISGDWDYDALKEVLASIEDFDLRELTGFEEMEINLLLDDYSVDSVIEEIPEPDDVKGESYIVYLSFPDKMSAEKWLIDNGYEKKFRGKSKTIVVRM